MSGTDIVLADGAEVLVRISEPDEDDESTIILVMPGHAYELEWSDALILGEALVRACGRARSYGESR